MNLDPLLDQYGHAHRHPINKLCHKIGIPMILISLIALAVTWGDAWAWWLFGVGWVFQFIGHAFERTWPEFMKNPVFLFVGPVYFVRELRRRKAAQKGAKASP